MVIKRCTLLSCAAPFFFLAFRRASSTAFPWSYSSPNFGGASCGLFIHLGWPHLGGAGLGIRTQGHLTAARRFVHWTTPHPSLWIVHCNIQKTYLSILSNSALSHKLLWQEWKGRFHGSEFFFILSVHNHINQSWSFSKNFLFFTINRINFRHYFVLRFLYSYIPWLIFVHGGCTVQYGISLYCNFDV
jgi:hypothetical protein